MLSLRFSAFLTFLPILSCTAKLPKLGGVNLSGLEWGIGSDGSVSSGGIAYPPPISQIAHFSGEGANLFRIPIGWQYIQPTLNGALNQTYLAILDSYIESVTNAGAYAILDVHNYARLNGQIVGESSALPASSLANLWTQLAAKYKDQQRVIFGLMNEPHDLTLSTWIQTVQTVVTAIRNANAANPILIPGDNWTGLWAFPTFFKAGLANVTNPDGTYDNLIFDIHRYLDTDGSGTSSDCVNNRVTEVQAAAALLSPDNRQAILSETGGGSTSSCETLLPQEIAAVVDAYPAFAGFAIWSAGSFESSYGLSIVPDGNTDAAIWDSVKPYLP